jgi:lipoprotein-releasing system permease protein
MHKVFLSLRYLRTRKIIFLCVLGVVVGVAALIVVASVMEGFKNELRDRIRGFSAHLKVYPQFSFSEPYIRDYESLIEAIESVDGVAAASPRVEWPCLIGRDSEVHSGEAGFTVIGIDSAREASVSHLASWWKEHPEGDPLRPNGRAEAGAMIGAAVLSQEAFDAPTHPGDPVPEFPEEGSRIDVVTYSDNGGGRGRSSTVKRRSLTIVNRVFTGFYEFDSSVIYCSLQDAQEFLQIGDRVTSIAVQLDDYTLAGVMEERIKTVLDEFAGLNEFGFHVRSWEREKQNFLQAVDLQKSVTMIIIFCIVIVAGFNLMAILTMLVAEKTRDIGILTALGASRGGIASIFVTEGVVIAVLGNLLGVPLGLVLATNLDGINQWISSAFGVELFQADVYGLSQVPVHVDYAAIGWIFAATLVVCLLFSVIPARKASKLIPMEALRYE